MRRLLLILALLSLPTLAAGQVINNPTTIEFDPSADHDSTTVLLTSYVLVVTGRDIGGLSRTTDIGKPAPVAGKITYTGLAAAYAGLPTCPIVAGARSACYTVGVAAKGPGGQSSTTVASDPFSSGTPVPPLVPPRVPAGKPVIR